MNEELGIDLLNPPSTDYLFNSTQDEQSSRCYFSSGLMQLVALKRSFYE